MNNKEEYMRGVEVGLREFRSSERNVGFFLWFVENLSNDSINRESYFLGKYAVYVFAGNKSIDYVEEVATERFK